MMSVLTLTAAAAEKCKQLLERDQRDGCALRVQVMGGGCGGLKYRLLFDQEAAESDHEDEQNGVRILVDAESAVQLAGSTLDYVDDLNGSGFKVYNPGASSSCGCGQSFGV